MRQADVQLVARILSMGVLHHAFTGTGAVVLTAALAVPSTVPQRCTSAGAMSVRFGHPSGTAREGAQAVRAREGWQVIRVSISRSARRLMDGHIFVPPEFS